MSSPIATRKKNRIDTALISLHQKLSHNRRINILAEHISDAIKKSFPSSKVRCLDVGCGDMQIAERIKAIMPETEWTCIDIYDLPEELKHVERWGKYKKFDGINIPFADNSFDIVLFCDVLHHVQTNAQKLLGEAGRVGSFVAVKDHFEYSICSRIMLLGMDFIGNFGYGVALPKRYFTRKGFAEIIKSAGLSQCYEETEIDLYKHIPYSHLFLKPKWQFVSILCRSS